MGISGKHAVTPQNPAAQPDLVAAIGFEGRSVVSVGELAKALRVTVRHITDLIDEGQLVAINVSGSGRRHYRIPIEALRKFLQRRHTP